MTDRDIIRRALFDAIDWQLSFADANHKGSDECKKALALVKKYKAVLRRRYKVEQTPGEWLDASGTMVSIYDIKETEPGGQP